MAFPEGKAHISPDPCAKREVRRCLKHIFCAITDLLCWLAFQELALPKCFTGYIMRTTEKCAPKTSSARGLPKSPVLGPEKCIFRRFCRCSAPCSSDVRLRLSRSVAVSVRRRVVPLSCKRASSARTDSRTFPLFHTYASRAVVRADPTDRATDTYTLTPIHLFDVVLVRWFLSVAAACPCHGNTHQADGLVNRAAVPYVSVARSCALRLYIDAKYFLKKYKTEKTKVNALFCSQ